jgi:hypothetical protein
MSNPKDRWSVDLYSEGTCVYELDAAGEVVGIVAWARNSLAAAAAFDEICKRQPGTSFSRRRRSHVEADRLVEAPTIRYLIDHQKSLTVSCSRCNRHVVMDLNAIGNRLGYDHRYLAADLVPKLRCSQCGSKNVSLQIAYAGAVGCYRS